MKLRKRPVKEFEDLYASFLRIVVRQPSKMTNLWFGRQWLLDVLTGSSEYTAAIKVHDDLCYKSHIQSVNSQFNTGAIVDGLLKTMLKWKKTLIFHVSCNMLLMSWRRLLLKDSWRGQQLPAPARLVRQWNRQRLLAHQSWPSLQTQPAPSDPKRYQKLQTGTTYQGRSQPSVTLEPKSLQSLCHWWCEQILLGPSIRVF